MARQILELAPSEETNITLRLYHASQCKSVSIESDTRCYRLQWFGVPSGTETLRKVDQWQRALQMDPAPQATQATCNVALAAIPAWQEAISFSQEGTLLKGPLRGGSLS